MMDWLFTEMEEHSKKLGMYSDWYDYFQRGINVDDEFSNIMQLCASQGLTDLADPRPFLQTKQRAQGAASRGAAFRAGGGGGENRSQSASGQIARGGRTDSQNQP